MKLSEIFKNQERRFGIEGYFGEKPFQSLGLVVSDVNLKLCTFIDNEKYIDMVSKKDNITMIITTRKISKLLKGKKGICISQNPRTTFFKIHNYLVGQDDYKLKDDFDTLIGTSNNISPLSYIANKNVTIGNNVTIEEFVSIKENTIIGDNVYIGAGSVISGEGFEFKRYGNDEIVFVKHAGWVQIDDNVMIKYNTCVDKAIYPWDITHIAEDSKLDNLVHIAHGVKIDKRTFIVAGALIGGRTIIGSNSWVGVGATISNGLKIGTSSSINIGAVATRDVKDNQSVTGNFAVEHNKFIDFIKSIR